MTVIVWEGKVFLLTSSVLFLLIAFCMSCMDIFGCTFFCVHCSTAKLYFKVWWRRQRFQRCQICHLNLGEINIYKMIHNTSVIFRNQVHICMLRSLYTKEQLLYNLTFGPWLTHTVISFIYLVSNTLRQFESLKDG